MSAHARVCVFVAIPIILELLELWPLESGFKY